VAQEQKQAALLGIDLAGFRRSLRQSWRVLLALAAVGVMTGALWCMAQTKMYTSDAIAVVSVGATDNIGLGMAADQFARSKATQYKALADSRVVQEDALKKAGLKPGPGGVNVAVPLDTAQLRVSVTRDNPKDAQALADAYVSALATSVDAIENQELPGVDRAANAPRSVVKVLQFVPAQLPGSASYPPVRMALAAGLLVGLLLGALYAAIKAIQDRRIRSVDLLENEFGLSVVGTIPQREDKKVQSRLLLDDKVPDWRIVEAFKELRTNVQFMNPDHPPRVFAVTSPLPAEGKSTVAANLAITLADSGVQVALVDGDLRRPTVTKSFQLVENVGLTDVVVDRARLEDVIQEVPAKPGLVIVGAGLIPPNPSEILASDKFRDTIQELAKDRIVILDAPPLLPVTDAAIVGARFDGVLLVLQAGRTTTDELGKALSTLEKVKAHVLGAIFNKVPTGKDGVTGYNYYGHYYYYGSEGASAHGDQAGAQRERRSSRSRSGRRAAEDSRSRGKVTADTSS
jgi:capsular exopolysaccharide synthesis family protein